MDVLVLSPQSSVCVICTFDQDIMKQKLRVLRSGANVIESVEKEVTDNVRKLYHEQASNFIRDNGLDSEWEEKITNENIAHLSKGIEKLSQLMFKGVEIYARLSASPETIKLFPQKEEVKKLPLEVPKLTANIDSDEN